jgi:hypothetical protein
MPDTHWRRGTPFDLLNLVLGLILFASPWAVDFKADSTAFNNAVSCGGIIMLLSIAAVTSYAMWEEWANLIVGLWAAYAPWALGFQTDTPAVYTHVVLGGLIALAAAFDMWMSHRVPPRLTV